jgi:hypothetical protein
MKILLLTLAPVLSREAPAVQVANMAQAFADLGHDVTVVATVADPTIDADQPERLLGFRPSFRIMTLSRRIHRGQSYLHALRIARLARRGGFDLVFSRNLRGALLPALRGVPTVFEAHTLSSLTGAQDRRILARLLRTPGFRGIVAISQGLADDLVAEFRRRPRPCADRARRGPDRGRGSTARSARSRRGSVSVTRGRCSRTRRRGAARNCSPDMPWIELHRRGSGRCSPAASLRRWAKPTRGMART